MLNLDFSVHALFNEHMLPVFQL